MRADMEMLLFLFLLTVSKVLGRGLTIDPTSFTTHDYTPQVDHIGLLGVYSQVAAIGDPVSQFCCGEPPRRQHKLSLQLSDPLACPVLLSLVNHKSDMIKLKTTATFILTTTFCMTTLSPQKVLYLYDETGVAIVRDLPPFGGHLLKTSEVSKFIEIALEENILLIGFSICY